MALADVTSGNTVGFTTIENLAAGKFALGAIQFQNTSSQSANINDILTCSVATPDYDAGDNYIDGWYENAAQIQVRSGNSYVIYYYCSQAEHYNADLGDYEYIPGWTGMFGNYIEDENIAPGHGIWFKAPNNEAADFVVAGQVVGTASAQVTGAAGFNLVANPFPVAFNINSAKVDWGLVPTPDYDEGDNYINDWYESANQMQVRSGNSYVIYYYCSQAERYNATLGDYEYIPGWTGMFGDYIEDETIAEGAGFWLKGNAAFTTTTTL